MGVWGKGPVGCPILLALSARRVGSTDLTTKTKATQRNESILRHNRLLLQHHFAIQRRHTRVVRRISLLLRIPCPLLFFTGILRTAQLVQITLLFLRDNSFAQ